MYKLTVFFVQLSLRTKKQEVNLSHLFFTHLDFRLWSRKLGSGGPLFYFISFILIYRCIDYWLSGLFCFAEDITLTKLKPS